jgi:hypothetical protein
VALPDASRKPAILARKDFPKRRERQGSNPPAAPHWLACAADLGTRIKKRIKGRNACFEIALSSCLNMMRGRK